MGWSSRSTDCVGGEGDDFGNEVLGQGLDGCLTGGLTAGLGDVIGGTGGERLERDGGAALGERAAHNYGDSAMESFEFLERAEAVQAGHLHVEQDQVGLERVDDAQG